MNRNYPAEIEEQSIALARITEQRDEAKAHLEEVTDRITSGVLADLDETTGKPRHSNDKARELAIRERQRASGEWNRWVEIQKTSELNRVEAAAKLERLRGEFSESKLERRERVAAIEAAIG